MRSGLALNHQISFATGFPDAEVSWQVKNMAGTVVGSGATAPDPGAVSFTIEIPPTANTLPVGVVLAGRDLTWSYTTSSRTESGAFRYQVEAQLPFFASERGVRNMLGIAEVEDLSDEDIGLVRAYLEFENTVGAAALASMVSGSVYNTMKIAEGIEAQAGLRLLPTLQVRVAKRETSGTNQYDRGDIDWEILGAQLAATVLSAAILVNPELDVPSSSTTSLLTVVTPATDLFPDG